MAFPAEKRNTSVNVHFASPNNGGHSWSLNYKNIKISAGSFITHYPSNNVVTSTGFPIKIAQLTIVGG